MSPAEYETPASIATAINRGDKAAESVLYEKYYRSTLYILERRTGDPETARDLCHEAFCVLIERLRKEALDDPDRLPAFLHQIAVNLHIGEVRKSTRRNTVSEQETVERYADTSQDQYLALVRERSAILVRSTIQGMTSSRDRKILYAYYIEERDKEEICGQLALSHRHFDKVLFRAKRRFRALAEEILETRSQQTLETEVGG